MHLSYRQKKAHIKETLVLQGIKSHLYSVCYISFILQIFLKGLWVVHSLSMIGHCKSLLKAKLPRQS